MKRPSIQGLVDWRGPVQIEKLLSLDQWNGNRRYMKMALCGANGWAVSPHTILFIPVAVTFDSLTCVKQSSASTLFSHNGGESEVSSNGFEPVTHPPRVGLCVCSMWIDKYTRRHVPGVFWRPHWSLTDRKIGATDKCRWNCCEIIPLAFYTLLPGLQCVRDLVCTNHYTMSVASSTRESQRFDLLLVDIKRSFKRSQKFIVCRGWKTEQVLIRKEKKRTLVVYFCKFKVGWARFPPATPVITLSSAHQLSHPYLFHKVLHEYKLTNPISQS